MQVDEEYTRDKVKSSCVFQVPPHPELGYREQQEEFEALDAEDDESSEEDEEDDHQDHFFRLAKQQVPVV